MSREYPDIGSAVAALAAANRKADKGGELIVPRRVLIALEKKYKSSLTINELCGIYVKEYYH